MQPSATLTVPSEGCGTLVDSPTTTPTAFAFPAKPRKVGHQQHVESCGASTASSQTLPSPKKKRGISFATLPSPYRHKAVSGAGDGGQTGGGGPARLSGSFLMSREPSGYRVSPTDVAAPTQQQSPQQQQQQATRFKLPPTPLTSPDLTIVGEVHGMGEGCSDNAAAISPALFSNRQIARSVDTSPYKVEVGLTCMPLCLGSSTSIFSSLLLSASVSTFSFL